MKIMIQGNDNENPMERNETIMIRKELILVIHTVELSGTNLDTSTSLNASISSMSAFTSVGMEASEI